MWGKCTVKTKLPLCTCSRKIKCFWNSMITNSVPTGFPVFLAVSVWLKGSTWGQPWRAAKGRDCWQKWETEYLRWYLQFTCQLKSTGTQIPSSGFVDTKRTIKKYYSWLLQGKVGKFCEKRKKIWTCISAYCMVRCVVADMLLNVWPRKPSFVLCTHTGLGCTLLVGVLPCAASLDFSA